MNRKMQVAALLGATMLSTSVWAQETDEIIVYSSPFKKAATDVISTTEIIDADTIAAQANRPLGKVLSDLPGVSSAGFGPAVGQPVIRGLTGYRVDVMQNGMTVGDISNAGGDHTNLVNLHDTDRIEVLKGPAALRYGAFAATGVVNSFNRHLDGEAEDGTDVLLDFGDNAEETVSSFFARRGTFALSGYAHEADDIEIPGEAETEAYHAAHSDDDDEEEDHDESETANTHHEGSGFSLSGQFGNDQTGLAVMLSSAAKEYGVPGHSHEDHADDDGDDGDDHDEHEGEAVYIDLEQQAVHTRLMHTPSSGMFNSLQADLVFTTLEQDEYEGEAVGLSFEQDTLHLRGEATASLNDWQALFGLEWRDTELETSSEEEEHADDDDGDDGDDGDDDGHGFLPSTETTQYGLFAFAERENNGWLTELAVRFDNVELEAEEEHHDDEDDDDGDEEHHDEGAISFDLTNISAGLARKLDGNLLVGGSISSTERAPSQVELFANGRHAAASRDEFGDDELEKETSLSTELYVRKAWDANRLRVAIFQNDYSDFIYLDARDGVEDTFDYNQQDAEVSGYEIDYQTVLMLGGRMWDASLSYSSVTGELSDGGNLPAIPADKIGFGLGTTFETVSVQLDVEQVSDQSDTAEDELETDGFTNIDITASWQPPAYEGLTLSAGIRNVTDEEIRHHTSPLKDKMPEAGRDIRLTARYRF